MLQFWFLWLFIAIVVVIVAFTLRKERDDVPRKDISVSYTHLTLPTMELV